MSLCKILVACHKPDKVYQDDIYTPIHVGRAISKFRTEMADMIGDDTGDNISELNPLFCELTALYWAWKNLKDVQYIGLCHYRRYFHRLITHANVDKIVAGNKNVLLVKTLVEKTSLFTKLRIATSSEDVYILMACIKKLFPDYYQTALIVGSANYSHPYNMFVMSKENFNRYAEWLFSILFETKKYVRLSGYTRARRIFGYFSEVLLPIYCIHNKLNIKTDYYTGMVGDRAEKKLYDIPHFLYHNFAFYAQRPQKMYLKEPAIIAGLKADGIDLDF